MRCLHDVRLVGSLVEPITLAEANFHLRLIADSTDVTPQPEDATVSGLISAARAMAENYLNRPVAQAEYELRSSYFGASFFMSPVQQVASVQYVRDDGVLTTIPNTVWMLGGTQRAPTVQLKYGQSWPTDFRREEGMARVRFTAGYGGDQPLPANIRAAMLLVIGHLYENREAVTPGAANEVPLGATFLLDPDRLGMGL